MKKLFLSIMICVSFYSNAQTIALQTVASGFSNPVEIVNAGDSRLFVVQQRGLIRILNPTTGVINATPFLDVTTLVNQSGNERGLLGMTFHPNYATNGMFFISYTRTSDGANVIAKYTVSANPDVANTTGTVILTQSQPQSNHNGGCIRFGPDGYLYFGIGDGGGAGDTSNNSQNLNTNLGKLLRINIDGTSTYTIPPGNPFAGSTPGNDEIWAYGLRNPWKFCFDFTTNNLWIADVGQNVWEEVNRVPSTSAGLNYGWRCKEGNADFDTSVGCTNPSSFTAPVLVANHGAPENYCSITGGYVYRGTEYPNLVGKYVFGDFCEARIGYMENTGPATYSANLGSVNISTFGEDNLKRLYAASLGGTIYKVQDTSLSSETFNNGLEFSIYPNPSNGNFTVKLNEPSNPSLEVFSSLGQLVYETKTFSNDVVNVHGLQTGLYFVKITNSGISSTKKIIIE